MWDEKSQWVFLNNGCSASSPSRQIGVNHTFLSVCRRWRRPLCPHNRPCGRNETKNSVDIGASRGVLFEFTDDSGVPHVHFPEWVCQPWGSKCLMSPLQKRLTWHKMSSSRWLSSSLMYKRVVIWVSFRADDHETETMIARLTASWSTAFSLYHDRRLKLNQDVLRHF